MKNIIKNLITLPFLLIGIVSCTAENKDDINPGEITEKEISKDKANEINANIKTHSASFNNYSAKFDINARGELREYKYIHNEDGHYKTTMKGKYNTWNCNMEYIKKDTSMYLKSYITSSEGKVLENVDATFEESSETYSKNYATINMIMKSPLDYIDPYVHGFDEVRETEWADSWGYTVSFNYYSDDDSSLVIKINYEGNGAKYSNVIAYKNLTYHSAYELQEYVSDTGEISKTTKELTATILTSKPEISLPQ